VTVAEVTVVRVMAHGSGGGGVGWVRGGDEGYSYHSRPLD
jgi:hypothetical protein